MEPLVVLEEPGKALRARIFDANALFGSRRVVPVFLKTREDPRMAIHDVRRSPSSVARIHQDFFRVYLLSLIKSLGFWVLEGGGDSLTQLQNDPLVYTCR